eukprot:CAMPEP_0116042496 /NCGR_PEP_ID=MMETSP0321-20121206/25730_1 /TAXON_ID=163516 /ORGANISM="Leptocylindrus danicus var. danicus, Strain B650" /LENGTH=371 /DNA_ID=CAMNT_0003522995 /DNA_START=219 /DNA_END=1334 /DNA_ORIENTATION=-
MELVTTTASEDHENDNNIAIVPFEPNQEFVVRMFLPPKLQHADVQFVVQSSNEGGTFQFGGCDNLRTSGFGTGVKDDIVFTLSGTTNSDVSIWGGWATEHEAVTLTPKVVLKLKQQEQDGNTAAAAEASSEEGNEEVEAPVPMRTTTTTDDATYMDDPTQTQQLHAEQVVLEDERMIQQKLKEVADMQAKLQQDIIQKKKKMKNMLLNTPQQEQQEQNSKQEEAQDHKLSLSETTTTTKKKKRRQRRRQDGIPNNNHKLSNVQERFRDMHNKDGAAWSKSNQFNKMKELHATNVLNKKNNHKSKIGSGGSQQQQEATTMTMTSITVEEDSDDPESSFSIEMFPFACFFALFVVIISLSIAQGSQSNRQHIE